MADQNEILRIIPGPGTVPASLDELSVRVFGEVFPVGSLKRKQLIKGLGALVSRGFVRAVKREKAAFQQSRTAGYELTDNGAAFRLLGKEIKSGPRKGHTGKSKPRENTFRTRVWKALRFAKKATVFELIEVAGAPGNVRTAATNTHRYLQALEAVKVTRTLDLRAPGAAPTSNGFIRYALVKDLGPQAPVVGTKGVFDPNSATYLAPEGHARSAQSEQVA
jgi:hypothetical protein